MAWRAERRQQWMKHPTDWLGDDRMLKISLAARGLFLSMVAYCHKNGLDGSMTDAQVTACVPPGSRWRTQMEALTLIHLVSVDRTTSVYRIQDVRTWDLGGDSDVSSSYVDHSEPARQKVSHDVEKPRAPTRTPARAAVRGKEEIEREKESIRSPSGSDRMDSARAAPRGSGGAAQPTQEDQQPGGSLGRDASRQMITEAIANR